MLLDHEDFQTSRKALLIVSVGVLVLHRLNIQGTTFAVWGLSFTVSRDTILGLMSLFFAYFLYVFLWRTLEYGVTSLDKRFKEQEAFLDELRGRNDEWISKFSLDDESEDRTTKNQLRHDFELVLKGVRDLSKYVTKVQRRVMYLVEFLPPVLFAAYVMFTTDTARSARIFILNY